MPLLEGISRSTKRQGQRDWRRWQEKDREASEAPRGPEHHNDEDQPRPNSRVAVVNSTRIDIENNTTTRASKMASKKELHNKSRNMNYKRNKKTCSAKSALTSNRKRTTINSKIVNM